MIKIYGINIGFEYEEYSDFKVAVKKSPIYIVQFKQVGTHKSSSDNFYELFKVNIFDNTGQSVQPSYNGWTNVVIGEPWFSWGGMLGSVNYYSISDSEGVVKEEVFISGIHGVIKLLKRLLELSKFDNWKQYEISLRINELQDENQELKNEIEELETEKSILIEKLEKYSNSK